MKKNYFLLAAAALMFAACAETDFVNPVPVNEGEAIGFETFANNSTRALDGTDLEKYTTTFGVWAYKTPSDGSEVNVMNNYEVENIDSAWVYAGQGPSSNQVLKYWDKLASYEFFAYAPYQASGVTISSDTISIADGEYAANENLQTSLDTLLNNTENFSGTGTTDNNKSTDWMVATKIERVARANDIVNETFYHTMSKLVVILKSTVDSTTVTSVSVGNVYGSGSCKITPATSSVAATWTPSGAVKSIPGVTGAITDITKGYYSMEYLLIPSTPATPTFSIEYTINGEPYVVTDAAISDITSFKENTIYTLTVTIGPDPIVFDATATAYSTPLTPGVEVE